MKITATPPPPKPERMFTIVLTEAEATKLRKELGRAEGTVTSNIWTELQKLGVTYTNDEGDTF